MPTLGVCGKTLCLLNDLWKPHSKRTGVAPYHETTLEAFKRPEMYMYLQQTKQYLKLIVMKIS
jgi:hypothetical protein